MTGGGLYSCGRSFTAQTVIVEREVPIARIELGVGDLRFGKAVRGMPCFDEDVAVCCHLGSGRGEDALDQSAGRPLQ